MQGPDPAQAMNNPLDTGTPAPDAGAVAATPEPAPAREAALRMRGLDKRFGKIEVLRGLDWEVPVGRVLGLLGRNGAGKSTLIRCLLGISPIDGGEVEVLGAPVAELGGERLHRIGYVPQSFDLFPWMKVKSYLAFTRAFYARWDEAMVTRLLADWEINPKQKIGQLSQGQRQKLAIVRALAPDPDLLILDEPVASLDPLARRDFMAELLAQARRPGKTILFSTHITSDLERAEAEIALLKDGRIQFVSSLEALRARVRRVRLVRDGGWEAVPALEGSLRGDLHGNELRLIVDAVPDEVLAGLAARESAQLTLERLTLEEIFVELG